MLKKTTIFLFTLVLNGLVNGDALAETCVDHKNDKIAATTPNDDFLDNEDGTVIHIPTGLMWMRCSLGQSWNGSSCTGMAASYNWHDALAAAKNLNSHLGYAGHTDWRLPNKNELASIIEEHCFWPAINAAVFPDTPSGWWWSSSPYAGSPNHAWTVGFWEGEVSVGGAWHVGFEGGNYNPNDKSGLNRIRLVRAGQ